MSKLVHQIFGSIFLAMAILVMPAAAQQGTGDFIPPALNPAGAQLETKRLGPGIYALISNKPPVDNSGFVVGNRGVLVIDAHINGEMAKEIQRAVRQVTKKPILYLINTNYHGDHTFGNYAFPAETMVVAQRNTAERMRLFDQEKQFLLPTVNNDPEVFANVRLRLPDVVFDDYLRLDLGERIVELYHFGAGNTAGDTVVYLPEAKVAWTGNLILGEGTIPFLIEGGAAVYLKTVSRFAQELDVQAIVPGHGPMTSAAILGRYALYLSDLLESARKAVRSGQKPEEAFSVNLPVTQSVGSNSPGTPPPSSQLAAFVAGIHKRNLRITYEEMREIDSKHR